MPDDLNLNDEDAKLVTLARACRVRTEAPEAAAVRDVDGRTYVATSVQLASLQLSALQTAVAMAVSSGATGLEAAAVVSDAGEDPDVTVVRDAAGADVMVLVADPAGVLRTTLRT
ncbi:MAG: cytidine deaminase [Actinomycetota bacterium]|nr:cytidine deaminase [Actinomycetota bacterium]